MQTYDAIVIGAGHNGLACACYVARAGLRTLLVEEHEAIGGMTATEELTIPGFHSDVHASGYQLANISPAPGELGIFDRGVELLDSGVPWAHAFPDGSSIVVHRDLERTIADVAVYSERDAATVRDLFGRYRDERETVVDSLFSPPPGLAESTAAMSGSAAGLDRYRFGLQSMRSWCDETFEDERTKCLFGAFAPFVGHGPDDAAGAEIAWLFASVLQVEGNKLVKGGMGRVPLAMAELLEELGGEIRTGASVERILVEDGRASAVRLRGGEEIAAGLVASSAEPRRLALELLGAEAIGSDALARAERVEWGDAVLVIYAAFEGPVDYAAGTEVGEAAHVHLCAPSLDAMATPVDQCRAGDLPEAPVVVSWNDSTVDPSRAPEGRALKKFVVLGVPYEVRGDATGSVGAGPWDEIKERYADHIVAMLDTYLPDLGERMLARTTSSPLDLERRLSTAVRGTIPHGAMIPYQSGSLRPFPGFGGYRSPVANVYPCGSESHPGAGVSMAAGRNAAGVICADLGVGPAPGEPG